MCPNLHGPTRRFHHHTGRFPKLRLNVRVGGEITLRTEHLSFNRYRWRGERTKVVSGIHPFHIHSQGAKVRSAQFGAHAFPKGHQTRMKPRCDLSNQRCTLNLIPKLGQFWTDGGRKIDTHVLGQHLVLVFKFANPRIDITMFDGRDDGFNAIGDARQRRTYDDGALSVVEYPTCLCGNGSPPCHGGNRGTPKLHHHPCTHSVLRIFRKPVLLLQ